MRTLHVFLERNPDENYKKEIKSAIPQSLRKLIEVNFYTLDKEFEFPTDATGESSVLFEFPALKNSDIAAIKKFVKRNPYSTVTCFTANQSEASSEKYRELQREYGTTFVMPEAYGESPGSMNLQDLRTASILHSLNIIQ